MTRGNSGANRGNRGRGRNDRGNSSGRHNRGPGQASVSAEGSTRLLATVGSAHITMPTGASREEGVKEEIDQKLGFVEFSKGPAREGWMVNMHPRLIRTDESLAELSAVDYYFIQEDGNMFKSTKIYEPYFFVLTKNDTASTVEDYLMKTYHGLLSCVVRVKKVDLKMANHLKGSPRLYLRLHFQNVNDLLKVRQELLPLVLKNSGSFDALDPCDDLAAAAAGLQLNSGDPWGTKADSLNTRKLQDIDPRNFIIDIREHDVPYYLRVAIDNDIRVGLWYIVSPSEAGIEIKLIEERVKRAEPVVMAYDIEVTKAPLKFPDQDFDQIMLISYMIDGQGYLINNRDIVSEDIADFEYTPTPEFEGPFSVFNEPDEEAVIRRWFQHIQQAKPTIIATYNGDSFDFPFVEARARFNGLDMYHEIGFRKDLDGQFKSRACIHMDCFQWVQRDSYLPQGSHGLKAVTAQKLGYNPIELDPELMTPYARVQPQVLAQYSVSDAVATYFLYMKYVHPFIFSLCNIIPLNPDEVLRKGSGTLCETLLMVEAYRSNVIMPNRHEEDRDRMFNGHLLASETYVGGHVEALEPGVFRSDIAANFKLVPSAIAQLIGELDSTLKFCIIKESKLDPSDITNYDEIRDGILAALKELLDKPERFENPLIYHLDVAAMYPNIMLSNRLQPDSVVDEATCALCDYNRPGKSCDRRMAWAWRGEYFPAKQDEYNMIQHALQQETFPGKRSADPPRTFDDLLNAEKAALTHKRLGAYSQTVYKKTKETKVIQRETIICQRENPFYIDTVRAFRDRRYEYKGRHKLWKTNLDVATENGTVGEIDEAKKMIVLYDSLQLAHKCILNSFYGYVMRKGARWHSMEMAGITCLTGATIIQTARELVEQIGRPLELDTDGIWCMLPGTFPQKFDFKVADGTPLSFSYPCSMLNYLVHSKFTNHQFHDTIDPKAERWAIRSENSIFFELDGPYKAMILPSSKEEGKSLKKRYAVFNEDGSVAELKGFELKRRGELKLIKVFQSELFEHFLSGATIKQCYGAVASVANRWLDILVSKASTLEDDELVDLIAENRSMSKTLAEYGNQKSTSISTAKRLAEFLGDQMVKDKGLACKFVISAQPFGAPVTERAIPVAIFSAEAEVKQKYLRKWLKNGGLTKFDIRSIIDWEYYTERLGSVIQKLITIPAAMQNISNPVPRVAHPDWLQRRVSADSEKALQLKVTDFFKPTVYVPPQNDNAVDLEDIGQIAKSGLPRIAIVTKKSRDVRPKTVEVLPSVPNPIHDFRGFSLAMRSHWRVHRSNIKQHLGHLETGQVLPPMFSGAQIKHWSTKTWDIVQIRARDKPGEFTMWTYVDSSLVPITLRIPREFYVNLKTEAAETTLNGGYLMEPVMRTLPRGHHPQHLYKVSVAEATYLDDDSHFGELLNDPNVDGVYELQVPLVMRAILRLGSRGSIETSCSTSFNQAKRHGFDLDQLERNTHVPHDRPYLNGGVGLNFILLFHSSTPPRHIFAVFHPSGLLKIHLVDPLTKKNPLAHIAETYTSLLTTLTDLQSVIAYPESIQADVMYHRNEDLALKAVSSDLDMAQRDATVLVISSLRQQAWFEEMIPRVDRFPLLHWRGSKKAHSLETFPWQPDAVKKIVRRILGMGRWLYRIVHEASIYDIPVGNIDVDEPIYYTDIDFARRLLENDMVLWWSSSGRPDLGGREDEERAFDEMTNVEISVPGCYTNVCASIQVRSLALNAVVQSASLDRIESGGGPTSFNSTSFTFRCSAFGNEKCTLMGDPGITPQTFVVLKEMVMAWLRRTDGLVHLGVDFFWRWVSSETSSMFDPCLRSFIYHLMRETFLRMLTELRRLGSRVIAADFGHILLLTPKAPGTAAAYVTYLLSAINSQELFKGVDMETVQYYDFLLYMDTANLGGVLCEDPYAAETPAVLPIFMQWNIAKFLPEIVQPMFQDAIKLYILVIYRTKMAHINPTRATTHTASSRGITDGGASGQPGIQSAKDDTALEEFVSKRLTRRMLRDVTQIGNLIGEARGREELPDELLFPLLPGSHLDMDDPPLEYIKFACAVFGVVHDLRPEVEVMRGVLLKQIGVKPFSEEAAFKDPCEPFKLPMVTCRICSSIRDFDFCRDPDLMSSHTTDRTTVPWQCPICECDYDRTSIEAKMIVVVDKLLTQFQLQDLRCVRCRQIKTDNLSKSCRCGGKHEHTLSKSDYKRKLRVVHNIAIFHGLRLLQDYAGNILSDW